MINKRVLLTNDDGHNAEGIALLRRVAEQLTPDIWQVAPLVEQSGMGHALTYRSPLRLHTLGHQNYICDGTPTDCVTLGLEKVLKDQLPDMVLSGINAGENLGEGITSSGTVGAAMQATLMGVRAIAFSQVTGESYPVDWSVAEKYGAEVLEQLYHLKWPKNTLMNVNFPHVAVDQVKGIRFLAQGRRQHPCGMVECIDPRGSSYYWTGVLHKDTHPTAGTDLWGARNHYITVTPIQLDLTHHGCISELQSSIDRNFLQTATDDEEKKAINT